MRKCILYQSDTNTGNNNLVSLGGIRLHQVYNGSTQVVGYLIFGVTKCKITENKNNCHFTNAGGTVDYGTEVTNSSGITDGGYFYVTKGDCVLEILSKYDITGGFSNVSSFDGGTFMVENPEDFRFLNANNPSLPAQYPILDCGFFDYIKFTNDTITLKSGDPYKITKHISLPQLVQYFEKNNALGKVTSVRNTNSMFIGKASLLANFPNITRIDFNKTVCSKACELQEFGGLTKITNFLIGDMSNIGGALEDFVRAQRANGREACDELKLPWLSITPVTWKGAKTRGSNANTKLAWTATTMTLYIDGTTADTINE